MRLPEPYRMVSVDFATFRLSGVYMPNLLAKVPYWEALIAALSSQSASHALAIGDFNTCRAYLDEAGAIDATAHYMDAIEQIEYRDLWRHRYPDGRDIDCAGMPNLLKSPPAVDQRPRCQAALASIGCSRLILSGWPPGR
jgi:hypothetical protein